MKINFKFISSKLSNAGLTFFVAFPAIVVAVSLLITNYYNVNNSKKLIQDSYLSMLEMLAMDSESSIQGVVDSARLIAEEDALMNALRRNINLANLDEINKVLYVLKNFSDTYSLIEDCEIVDAEQRYVIAENGISDFNEFFEKLSIYDYYPVEYWQSIRFFGSDEYRVLSPTKRTTPEGEEIIIPVVFRRINGHVYSNLFVVNVRLERLIELGKNNMFTPGTRVYFLNRYTGGVFGVNAEDEIESILDKPLYGRLVSGERFFDFEVNGDKTFIISYPTSDNLVGYTYFAVVPYSDINKIQRVVTVPTILICIFFIVMAAIAVYGGANRIMTPIRGLAKSIGITEKDNIIENIDKTLLAMADKNESLVKALPFAQEKYLINYLNSSEYSIDEAAQDIIKSTLPFRYEYFAVVIIQMFPNDKFYGIYTSMDYSNILSGFYGVIKDEFADRFDTFLLHSEKETIYIILNSSVGEAEEEITAIIEKINNYLINDSDAIDLLVGVSKMHRSLEGLKKAHNEAVKTLKALPKVRPQIVFDKKDSVKFAWSDIEETELFNMLVCGRIEEAQNVIQNIVDENGAIDMRSRKQLYVQILNVVLRVRRVKKVSRHDGKLDYEIYSDIIDKSPDEIYREILLLIGSMETGPQKKNVKIDYDRIIGYIDTHFSDPDLSLEMIADVFETKTNYLSTIIKNKIGIGFKAYLLNLRMNEAKRLLRETDKNMQEIYQMVGFVSKQSFFRSFKSSIGITPGEYRKKNKQ